jgi:hypothetical protein
MKAIRFMHGHPCSAFYPIWQPRCGSVPGPVSKVLMPRVGRGNVPRVGGGRYIMDYFMSVLALGFAAAMLLGLI